MNYQELIDKYEENYDITAPERTKAIQIYWQMEERYRKVRRTRNPNILEVFTYVSARNGITIEEAEILYGIGKKEIEKIDKMTYSRRLYKNIT